MKIQNRFHLGVLALSFMIAAATHAAPDVDKAFARWDTDGNGTISAEEMQATSITMAQQSGEKKGMSAEQLEEHVAKAEKGAPQRFKKADTDGDGELSKEEFIAMREAQQKNQGQGKPAEKGKGEKQKEQKNKGEKEQKDK